ncbi:MAG: helix-turn-helix transcriptional regulator [Pseudomonadota bacterium]
MKYEQRVTTFRQRIEQVIRQSGLNHSRFAQSIGVDRSTLSQLLSEHTLRLPRADTIAAIAEHYQVSVDWLLGLTEQGQLGADLMTGPLEFEDFSKSTVNEKVLEWHQEAAQYKVRYIPATLPDLIKTEAVASYEFRRYGVGRTDQSIRDTHRLLIQQRREDSDMEACQSTQDIEGFAFGEGIWRDLPKSVRIDQLQNMADLIDELYPRFRWYLFDGRQIYTVAFTIFGPLRAIVFIGQFYLVLNSTEHIRLFSRRFDELIRYACVQPHEVGGYIRALIEKVESE